MNALILIGLGYLIFREQIDAALFGVDGQGVDIVPSQLPASPATTVQTTAPAGSTPTIYPMPILTAPGTTVTPLPTLPVNGPSYPVIPTLPMKHLPEVGGPELPGNCLAGQCGEYPILF